MDLHGGYEVEVSGTESEFQSLREEWTQLYEESSPRNPFLSHEWVDACWRAQGDAATLFILTLRRAGRLVGVAPLRLEQQHGFRVLSFMGRGWSEYGGWLHASAEPEAEHVLLQGLTALERDWDLLLLTQLADEHSHLHRSAPPACLHGGSIETEPSPYLRFNVDWDTLVRTGPMQLRHSLRPSRRWWREGGDIQRLPGPAAAHHVDELADIEARSWKSREGVQRLQSGPAQRLLRQALASLGARDEMEVWFARLGGKAVAFQINMVTPERVGYYYGAMDEEYRRYYPGGVLHRAAIEHAWQMGCKEYDFMSGSEPYKFGWTNGCRTNWRMALYPPTLRGRLAFALLVAPRWQCRRFAPTRMLLERLKLAKQDPRSLLPWGHDTHHHAW